MALAEYVFEDGDDMDEALRRIYHEFGCSAARACSTAVGYRAEIKDECTHPNKVAKIMKAHGGELD